MTVADQMSRLVNKLRDAEEKRNRYCTEYDDLMNQIQELTGAGATPKQVVPVKKTPSKVGGLTLGVKIQDALEAHINGLSTQELIDTTNTDLRKVKVSIGHLLRAGKVVESDGRYMSSGAYQQLAS